MPAILTLTLGLFAVPALRLQADPAQFIATADDDEEDDGSDEGNAEEDDIEGEVEPGPEPVAPVDQEQDDEVELDDEAELEDEVVVDEEPDEETPTAVDAVPDEETPTAADEELDEVRELNEGGEQETTVAPAAAFRVNVDCAFVVAERRTTCTFRGIADLGGQLIRQVAMPATLVCAPIVGGDHAYLTAAPDTRIPGEEAGESLGLVFAGEVRPEGTTTYWVTTEAGLFPAGGPGLTCPDAAVQNLSADVSATAGAVEIRVVRCAAAPSDPATFDWFGECTEQVTGASFALARWDGTRATNPQRVEETDAEGQLRFGQLPPGTYTLKQVGGRWCHAESDRVDDRGRLSVEVGTRANVWIFTCDQASPAATPEPAA